jgi:hypothetical protein
MGTVTSGYGGVVTPDTSENVDVPADMLALAASINAKVLGVFTDTTTRNTAYGTLPGGSKALCYLVGQGVQIHNGTTWEWVGNHAPVSYILTVGNAGSPFNGGTVAAQWNTASYTFTPTETGWASVWVATDAKTNTAGFGYATLEVWVSLGGGAATLVGSFDPISDSTGHQRTNNLIPVNVKLTAGQSTLFTAKVRTTFANGNWGIDGLTWQIVQQ